MLFRDFSSHQQLSSARLNQEFKTGLFNSVRNWLELLEAAELVVDIATYLPVEVVMTSRELTTKDVKLFLKLVLLFSSKYFGKRFLNTKRVLCPTIMVF